MRTLAMSMSDAYRLVDWAVAHSDLAWFDEKNYDWFANSLLRAAKMLDNEKGTSRRRALAARAYLLLGDIYDIYFEAPRAALRWYRRCINLDPNQSTAWAESGTMLQRMGNYRAAKRAWVRALALDPSNNNVQVDLDEVKSDIVHLPSPSYRRDNAAWRAAELIAQGKVRAAVSALGQKTSVACCRCRARAYEALGDHKRAVDQWRRIGRSKGIVELTRADFFFMSSNVWNSPSFWEAMLHIGNRFGPGMYPKDASFPDTEKLRSDRIPNRSVLLRICRRRWRLSSHLHLARTQGDLQDLRKLCKRYPQWDLAHRTLRALETS